MPELATDPPSPQDLDEFPDVPPGNDPDAGARSRPPDQPDLDEFAERLGLRSEEHAEGDGPVTSAAVTVRDRAASVAQEGVGKSRSLLARGLSALSSASAKLAERVRPDDRS